MAAISPAPNPTISGTAVYGYTLTAVTGTWATGTTFTYQWNRNGVAIAGATTSTYTLVLADVSYPITVTVTGTKVGYDNTVRTSAATSLVTNLILPDKGDNNWDVPVNNAFTNLDDRLTEQENALNVVPNGGTVGQILAKNTGTDYDTGWIDNYTSQVKHLVKNASGSTMPKGSVVYISGASGTNMLVSLADADSDLTSATTIGLLETSLSDNSSGYVVTEGLLSGLNTSTATVGDPMWLSSSSGQILYGLANKPVAPVHLVYLGTVTRVSATVGEVFVKISNGWELEELHNVKITDPQDGQVLKYQASTGLWINSAP